MATRPAPRPATRPAPRPASPPVPRAAPAQPKAPVGSQTRQQMLVPTAGMVGQQATGSRMAGMPEAGGPLNAQSGPYVQMPTPGPAPSALPVIPGCPVGLEYLTMIDHLLVQQQLQIKELFLGMQFNSKFIVKNSMGQFVFEAIENCYWHTLSSRRPFHMSLRDYRNIEVLKIVRPHRCDCFLCYCCIQAPTQLLSRPIREAKEIRVLGHFIHHQRRTDTTLAKLGKVGDQVGRMVGQVSNKRGRLRSRDALRLAYAVVTSRILYSALY
ncbi:phospholipid scramblase 2-like [Dermacentor silvarum]|uniref:phospholipid scramblase 2-like n=1 Tax=Dermacentor silvarum TaxID=543639 RepID=UPI0021019116|nr:phospholipid scramblase 2-like [Dermacentor silvarum]